MLERRRSRTTPEKRKQSYVESEGSETGSDGEWSGLDDPLSDHGREDEDEEEDEAVRRGRVVSVSGASWSGERCHGVLDGWYAGDRGAVSVGAPRQAEWPQNSRP